MGLFDISKDNNYNTFEDKLDHLVDGELPWGWYTTKNNFIEPRNKKIMDLHIKACNATSVKEEKELIETFLKAFFEYKEECIKLGECYIKYFTDMYEKCYNSKNPCFSLADPMKKRLEYINSNYKRLVIDKELKQSLMATLEADVEKEIISNPNILQSELIKKFNPIVKGEIFNLLCQWEKSKKIIKEKQGRSYILKFK